MISRIRRAIDLVGQRTAVGLVAGDRRAQHFRLTGRTVVVAGIAHALLDMGNRLRDPRALGNQRLDLLVQRVDLAGARVLRLSVMEGHPGVTGVTNCDRTGTRCPRPLVLPESRALRVRP